MSEQGARALRSGSLIMPWYVWRWSPADGSALWSTHRWRWTARRTAARYRRQFGLPGVAFLVARSGDELRWGEPLDYRDAT